MKCQNMFFFLKKKIYIKIVVCRSCDWRVRVKSKYGIHNITVHCSVAEWLTVDLFSSWDEMAKYDLPATIKNVLAVTQAQSLAYVGYSQGTEIAFAQFSQDSVLARQVRVFVALAPVAYLDGVISPIRLLAPFADDLAVSGNF